MAAAVGGGEGAGGGRGGVMKGRKLRRGDLISLTRKVARPYQIALQ